MNGPRKRKQTERDAVCLCVDEKMLIPAFFVGCHVRRNSPGAGREFDVIIVCPPGCLRPEHHEFGASSGIRLCDTLDLSPVSGIPILQARLSTATLIKLLLARHFGDCYRRILYLDADLTIHGDVGSLFQLDMGRFAVAAVRSWPVSPPPSHLEGERVESHFRRLGMMRPYRFFNTGVLLIDTANWTESNIDGQAIRFLAANWQKCRFPDEDALNVVLHGEILELSPIWNARQDIRSARLSNATIRHYAGPRKPWLRFVRGKGLFEDLGAYHGYKAFARETPWRQWPHTRWRTRDVVHALRQDCKRLWSYFVSRFAADNPSDV
jgi:lipopolysaccharide biosynthesis glycosyltransferase